MVYSYWGISFNVLLTLTCFCLVFLGADAASDELPEPENLSLSWSPDQFSVIAQWSKPANLGAKCQVKYELDFFFPENCPPIETDNETESDLQVSHLNYTWNTDENEVCVSIATNPVNCGDKKQSKLLHKGLSRPPGLVTNFTCVYYSDKKMNCSWSVINNAPDLQLFYRPQDESNLNSCVSYIGDERMKTGCHLYGEVFVDKKIFFLVNGTHEGVPKQSNFIRDIKCSVKIAPPKLKYNITADGKYLYVHASPPGFKLRCWDYHFQYRICDEEHSPVIINQDSKHVLRLEYNDACCYKVQVQAIYSSYCGAGGSELSEPVYYGKNRDPNGPLKVAMIITPIVVTCCFIVALMLCRRHKDYLFPKIPEPSLLFKDVLNSNKDKGVHIGKLYIPYEDVVEKKISLEPECTVLHFDP